MPLIHTVHEVHCTYTVHEVLADIVYTLTYPSSTLVTIATEDGLLIISSSSSASFRAAALTSRAERCPILGETG